MASKKPLKEKIASKVTQAGLSATSLAQKLGYTKAKQIMSDLQLAVAEGLVDVDSSGRFPLYKKTDGKKKAVIKAKSNTKTTVVEGEKAPKDSLPEASKSDISGFSVGSIKYKGKAMKKVSTPDGRKIRIEKEEKLLVINEQPKYVVKTAEDVIKCIRKYAMENGMTTFTVNDIKLNKKVTNDKDIEVKDDHIMFLSIRKHNKAAGNVFVA